MFLALILLFKIENALLARVNGHSECIWQQDVRSWTISSYTTDLLCSISFDSIVSVTIQKFAIDGSENCQADFLLYNGNQVCDTIAPATTSFFLWPPNMIIFESDGVDGDTNTDFRGVDLLVVQVSPEDYEIFPTSMSGPCSWNEIANWWYYEDYLPNMECSITFSVTVKILTREFDVGDYDDPTCLNDRVVFGEYHYCNSLHPGNFSIVNPGGAIKFYSDGVGEPGDHAGFRFAILPWDKDSELPTKHPSDVPSRTPSLAPTSTAPSTIPSDFPTLPIRFCDSSDCNGQGAGAGTTISGCTCDCFDGYDGQFCDVRVCVESDCNNHGVPDGSPFSEEDGCSCICDGNWQEPNCVVESCSRVDCNDNGEGEGENREDGCVCTCDNGWSGNTCETMACTRADCSSHGSTTDEILADGCDCNCDEGWYGEICNIPTCNRDADCNSNGDTIDNNRLDGCECICDSGYSGDSCEIEICTVADCSGAGTTSDMDKSDGCVCTCSVGFDGNSCSVQVTTETVTLYALFLYSEYFGMLTDEMIADLFDAMSDNIGFAIVLQALSKPRNNVVQFSAEANVANSVKFELLSVPFEQLITAQFLSTNSRRLLQSDPDFTGLYIDIVEFLPMPSMSPSIAPSQTPSLAPTDIFSVYVEYLYIDDLDYLNSGTAVNNLLSFIRTELNERRLDSEVTLLSNLGDNVIRITVTSSDMSTLDQILTRSFENAIGTQLREDDPTLDSVVVNIYLEMTSSTEGLSNLVSNINGTGDGDIRSLQQEDGSDEQWYETTWGWLILLLLFLALCVCCCIWYRVANIIMVDEIELMDDVKDVRETSTQYIMESQYIIGERKRGPTTMIERFGGSIARHGTTRNEQFTVEVIPSPKEMARSNDRLEVQQVRFNSGSEVYRRPNPSFQSGGGSLQFINEPGALHSHNRL